ncbi:hypothetical protein BDN70DRAFT_902361 [Pholiota conissans]|uniref:Uncharacterized protein n=1 Tax=Pholiota conissans TaxID=109636 RepID=A0A9P5YM69_9AGAR|nr:hypothetical protein BDN70DRAFT_902361 [Pholiota conissans]
MSALPINVFSSSQVPLIAPAVPAGREGEGDQGQRGSDAFEDDVASHGSDHHDLQTTIHQHQQAITALMLKQRELEDALRKAETDRMDLQRARDDLAASFTASEAELGKLIRAKEVAQSEARIHKTLFDQQLEDSVRRRVQLEKLQDQYNTLQIKRDELQLLDDQRAQDLEQAIEERDSFVPSAEVLWLAINIQSALFAGTLSVDHAWKLQ